jgi:ribosomal-protein-alanine N-acetyltransferase
LAILETPRLTFAPFTLDDAPFILDLLNQPSFLRNIGDRGVHTLADARAYIANGPVKSYAANGFGLWRVGLKPAEPPIGMCGLIRRPGLQDVDIGYAFLPPYWGAGYATEAAAATLDYGLRVVGLARIVGIVNPDNTPSIRVLEKIGLQFDGLLTLPGESTPVKVYAISRNSGV